MSGYVYAIGIEGSPLIKIGHARDPERRLATLQTGLPFKLILLYQLKVERPRLVEQCLHGMLENSRGRGEWFDVDPEELFTLFAVAVEQSYVIPSSEPTQLEEGSFGYYLHQAMDKGGWSQQTLALRSGVHRQQIYKLLHGERSEPRADTIRRIARALGVSADYLLGLSDDPTPPKPRRRARATG